MYTVVLLGQVERDAGHGVHVDHFVAGDQELKHLGVS